MKIEIENKIEVENKKIELHDIDFTSISKLRGSPIMLEFLFQLQKNESLKDG